MENYCPFSLQPHAIYTDKYTIVLDTNLEIFRACMVDTIVVIARLLNLSYANCLRYLRDQYGAQLIGKYQTHIEVLFDRTKELTILIRILNSRLLMLEAEFKDPHIYRREEDGSITRTDFDGTNETNSGTFKSI